MIHLALYKAPGNTYDRLIHAWTRSPYSHCELVLPNGRFVSSSPRDGGVRAKLIEPDPAAWVLLTLPWIQSRSRWFCSEFCAQVLGLEQPQRYSLGQLAEAIRWASNLSPIL